jgi:hypothetical protein
LQTSDSAKGEALLTRGCSQLLPEKLKITVDDFVDGQSPNAQQRSTGFNKAAATL